MSWCAGSVEGASHDRRSVLHETLIGLHAAAGVVAFAAGVACLPLRAPAVRFTVYLAALAAMVVFMIAAIGLDWAGLGTGTELLYLGLVLLGLVMLFRALIAHTRLAARRDGWLGRYLDDVGFTLISLFAGFVIVAAIDLGAPGWLAALIAAAGVAAGILAMNRVKRRFGVR